MKKQWINKTKFICNKIVRTINYIWIIILITLIIIVGLELVCQSLLPEEENPDYAVQSQMKAYDSEYDPWINKYITELKESSEANWVPYVYWRRQPYTGSYININENGIRKTVVPDEINGSYDDKLKIFMFGGSTLWGTGVRDSHTIPSLLSKRIHEKYEISAHIVNYGQSGYINTQELIALINEIQKENIPNVVIFLDGINEVYSTFQNREAGIPPNEYNRRIEFGIRFRAFHHVRKEFIRQVIKNSAIYKTTRRQKLKMFNRQPQTLPDDVINQLGHEIVKIYRNNVDIITSISDLYGFKTMFYWQPVIFTKNSLTIHETGQAVDKEYLKEFYLKSYSLIKDKMKDRPNFYDISEIFDNDQDTRYIDFCHVKEEANVLIADQIFEDLEELNIFD